MPAVENENIYTAFAEGYDRIMRDIDFRAWAYHILDLADRHGLTGNRILNLACGTGSTEPIWVEEGYTVVGVDQSEKMVALARKKNADPQNPRFLQADMRTVDLAEEFDLVCCLYDSLNYLTEPEDVRSCFERVHAHLKPGGGFIFDIATEANILENFSLTTYAENFDDFAYIWDNHYNLKTKICRSDFAFFYLDPETGHFLRRCETHYQRIHSSRDLSRWLKSAGFRVLGSYDGFTVRPPTPRSDRIHFVTQRR